MARPQPGNRLRESGRTGYNQGVAPERKNPAKSGLSASSDACTTLGSPFPTDPIPAEDEMTPAEKTIDRVGGRLRDHRVIALTTDAAELAHERARDLGQVDRCELDPEPARV